MIRKIEIVNWLETTDEYNVRYEVKIDGTTYLIQLQVERDPSNGMLLHTILNKSLHEIVLKNIVYAVDSDGNFLPEHRHVLANSHYHFFGIHNGLNWRFSKSIEFMSKEAKIEEGAYKIFPSTCQYIKDGRVATILLTIDNKSLHITYLHGAENLHPELEALLENEAVGYTMKTTISHYFGEWTVDNLETFHQDEFPELITEDMVGYFVTFKDERGFEFIGRIHSIYRHEDVIFVDMNNAFSKNAEKDFPIEVEILCIRDATDKELALGVPILS